MARKNKVRMPSSMGGLVRYFEDYRSSFEIRPGVVVVACVVVIALVLILRAYGNRWIG